MGQIIQLRPTPEREVVNLYEAEFLQLDEQVGHLNFGHRHVRQEIKDGLYLMALGLIAATTMGLLLLWVQS